MSGALQIVDTRPLPGDNQLRLENTRVDAQQSGWLLV
jgi:hypothetical protein